MYTKNVNSMSWLYLYILSDFVHVYLAFAADRIVYIPRNVTNCLTKNDTACLKALVCDVCFEQKCCAKMSVITKSEYLAWKTLLLMNEWMNEWMNECE